MNYYKNVLNLMLTAVVYLTLISNLLFIYKIYNINIILNKEENMIFL